MLIFEVFFLETILATNNCICSSLYDELALIIHHVSIKNPHHAETIHSTCKVKTLKYKNENAGASQVLLETFFIL